MFRSLVFFPRNGYISVKKLYLAGVPAPVQDTPPIPAPNVPIFDSRT